MIYAYPCDLIPDEEGSLVVTFPDVPEAITGGTNRAEALTMAEDALGVALAGYVQQKRDIPVPGSRADGQELVVVPIVVAAKLALYSAMRAENVTRAELAARLAISEAAVQRLADPDHRSHIDKVRRALQAVGHSLKVEVTSV